jgi:phosphoribosylglycinamide formyltransferase-1
MKTFAIYCSGGASRVRRLYANNRNSQFRPVFVLYDGSSDEIASELVCIFGDSLIRFSDKSENFDRDKPNLSLSNYLLGLLIQTDIDILLSFGSRVLRGSLLRRYRNRILNFHPSLLPSFKGLNAIDQALSHGVGVVGNTVHVVQREIDSGQIILQSVMKISDVSCIEDVVELQLPMFKMVLRDVCEYYITDEELLSDITGRVIPFLLQDKCTDVVNIPALGSVSACVQTQVIAGPV